MNGLTDANDPACSATNNNGNVTGTTTNNNPNTTGSTTNVYYRLMSCSDNQPYMTGPYPAGTYSTGSKVEGATNSYYIVTESGISELTNLPQIATSGTGSYGTCLGNNNSNTSTTPPVTYTVTVNVSGGSVYPSSIPNISSGGSASFFFYPDTGKSISNAREQDNCGGVSKTGTGGQYMVNNITSNCTISISL